MLPAEHMHFMIDSAKAVDMPIDFVVTPLVTQNEQALHHAITELELIADGLESGTWTDGLQKTSVWTDLVSVQAKSSKAVNVTTISEKLAQITKARDSHQCFLDSFGRRRWCAPHRSNDRAPHGDSHAGSHAVPQEG